LSEITLIEVLIILQSHLFFILQNMGNYINYKPPSLVKQGWIFWSTPDFKTISLDSEQITALLFINKKKEIGIIWCAQHL
jgi:hypothetical protein